jgi:hypothetical protein
MIMDEFTKYADEVTIGDRIIHDGETVTVTDVTPVPLTEEDYFGPAEPGRLTFEVTYADDTIDEFTRWESDLLTLAH